MGLRSAESADNEKPTRRDLEYMPPARLLCESLVMTMRLLGRTESAPDPCYPWPESASCAFCTEVVTGEYDIFSRAEPIHCLAISRRHGFTSVIRSSYQAIANPSRLKILHKQRRYECAELSLQPTMNEQNMPHQDVTPSTRASSATSSAWPTTTSSSSVSSTTLPSASSSILHFIFRTLRDSPFIVLCFRLIFWASLT